MNTTNVLNYPQAFNNLVHHYVRKDILEYDGHSTTNNNGWLSLVDRIVAEEGGVFLAALSHAVSAHPWGAPDSTYRELKEETTHAANRGEGVLLHIGETIRAAHGLGNLKMQIRTGTARKGSPKTSSLVYGHTESGLYQFARDMFPTVSIDDRYTAHMRELSIPGPVELYSEREDRQRPREFMRFRIEHPELARK